ncbi:MAG: HAD family hydrolase [Planctomycetota bacterium]
MTLDEQSARFDAVICDVDGCLSPETADPFDLPNLALIAAHNTRAIETGEFPPVTLCTGRPVPFAESMARAIRCPLPIMAENGAWIWDPSDNSHELDPSITIEHLDAIGELTRWVESELGPRGVTVQPGKRAAVSLYHPDTELLGTEVLRSAEARVVEAGWPIRVSMTWLYINLDLEHVSKASAIERWIAKTGIQRERLAGIGDTTSDRKIREKVSFFACPGNAQDELKAEADLVVESREAAGVVEILDRISGADG